MRLVCRALACTSTTLEAWCCTCCLSCCCHCRSHAGALRWQSCARLISVAFGHHRQSRPSLTMLELQNVCCPPRQDSQPATHEENVAAHSSPTSLVAWRSDPWLYYLIMSTSNTSNALNIPILHTVLVVRVHYEHTHLLQYAGRSSIMVLFPFTQYYYTTKFIHCDQLRYINLVA